MRAALVGLALVSCASSPPPACADRAPYVLVASDYTSTLVGGVTLDRATLRGGVDLGMDPVLAVSAGRPFVLARDTGAVFELDRRCGFPSAALSALPSGAGPANPWDLAIAGDGRAFVALYDAAKIAIAAPKAATVFADVASLDPDGNPEASALFVSGQRLFVALQLLDADYQSRRSSEVAVIDVTSAQIQKVVTLPGRNPFPPFVADGGALWLAAPGSFYAQDEADAGLVRFDPSALAATLEISERTLGGSLSEVRVDGACAVGIVADASMLNKTKVVAVDLGARSVTTLLTADGFFHRGVDLGKDRLVVGDRARASRGFAVHVIPRSGCAFDVGHEKIVPTSLPPVGVAAMP